MATKRIWSFVGQVLLGALLVFSGLVPAQGDAFGQAPTPTAAPEAAPGVDPAQASTWTQPVALERNGWFPDIAADSSGRLHIAWANSVIYAVRGTSIREGYDVVLYTSSEDNGDTWQPINEVAALKESMAGSVEVTRPALLVDHKGILHMTYRDIRVFYSNVPVQLANLAQYWTKQQQMTVNNLGYFSRLAVDSTNRLHMVWTEDVPTSDCLICYHLFYKYSDDDGTTWSQEVDVSAIPTGAAKPQLFVDQQDNIHVVWEAGRGGTLGQLSDPTTVMYAVSYNRGESWSPPIEVVAPDAERSKNIAIGQDGSGNLVVVWWSLPEDVPYYQVSVDNGLSWSNPERLPNVWGIWANYQSRLDTYSMATDSAGVLHLVMVGRLAEQDQSLRVLHLAWNGSAWSLPEAIVSYNGDSPEWPRIAISNGNQINVVWFVRGRDFVWAAAADYYKVWYSHSRSSAPFVAPTPWPTMLPPTPTPKATEELAPTATPRPNQPSLRGTVVVQQMDNAVYSEVDQLGVVGRSVIPVVGIVIVIMGVVLYFKRR